jgi:hypothetical protein
MLILDWQFNNYSFSCLVKDSFFGHVHQIGMLAADGYLNPAFGSRVVIAQPNSLFDNTRRSLADDLDVIYGSIKSTGHLPRSHMALNPPCTNVLCFHLPIFALKMEPSALKHLLEVARANAYIRPHI